MGRFGIPLLVRAYGKANGSIISFDDGADAKVRDLKIGIEPVQDLHGYDSPWPAGGGKNKLPNKTYQINAGAVRLGVDVNETEYIHLTAGTYTVSASLNAAAIFYIKGAQDTENTRIGSSSTSPGGTFTVSDDDDYTVWLYNSNGISANDVIWFQLESGPTATSYASYSNICPISGWSAVDLFRESAYDPTATPYIPITIPTPPGTVYGGYIHVSEDGSAELVVDRAEVDLGTLGWNVQSDHVFRTSKSNIGCKEVNTAVLVCSEYPVVTASIDNGMYQTTAQIRVTDSAYTDKDVFTAAMSGVQLVYELATPITYQLDPITVQTLLGQNAMWADSGNVDLTYIKKSLLQLGS